MEVDWSKETYFWTDPRNFGIIRKKSEIILLFSKEVYC